MMERLRLFIAVPLSREVEEVVAEIQAAWKRKGTGVRWVRPEGIHITLKFLGGVPKDNVQGIVEAMKAVAKRHRPFSVVIKGAGGFPSTSRARVLWIGVEDRGGDLHNLFEELEEALQGIGFPREDRSFKPHLTLGRVKDKRGKSFPFLQELREREIGVLEVKEMVLFRSQQKPQGAEYTPLAVVPLGG